MWIEEVSIMIEKAKSEIESLVDRLDKLIDECENDFEAMVFNPENTFELLLESHSILSRILREEVADD